VAGIWKSHDYDDAYGQWTIFSLDIQRVEGSETELRGTIDNHSWTALPEQSQPGPCRGLLEYKVSMDGRGRVEDGRIAFGGWGQWRLDEVPCGEFNGIYNLDNFTGLIDAELLEFQSVNNDGGRAVDHPVVFRRVACHAGAVIEDEPKVSVAPPPFYPPEEGSGGGCRCLSSKGDS
jgi:hypothetical protein